MIMAAARFLDRLDEAVRLISIHTNTLTREWLTVIRGKNRPGHLRLSVSRESDDPNEVHHYNKGHRVGCSAFKRGNYAHSRKFKILQ